MEKYIDLINAYLQKSLSESEVLAFENRLKSDVEFNTLYNEHLIILNGIQRTELKVDIINAKQSYVRGKWYKYLGISVGIILVSILVYSLILTSKSSASSNSLENNTVEFVSDTIQKEKIEIVERITDTISTKNVISENKVKSNTKKNDAKTSDVNHLISFFKSVKKVPQKITVNTEEDFKITLKEGTRISIPKNAFLVEKTNKQVSGNVELKVTEYYQLSDMLLADLSTTSNDKILETGGMLHVEANKNGSKLKLKKPITIIFNNSGKPNMQLFRGNKNDDGINWLLDRTEVTTSEVEVIDALTGTIGNEVLSFHSVEQVPVFPGCENGNNEEQKKCFSDGINRLINKNYNLEIAEKLNLSGRQRIFTSFEIDEEGNIVKIKARTQHQPLEDEAIRVLRLVPKLKPALHSGVPVTIRYSLPIVYQIVGETTNQLSVMIKTDNGHIETFEKKPMALITNSDIDRYTLATTRLGWINCDRFVNTNNKIKYKVKIKDADGANVKMIFKSISSVLPSHRTNNDYSFGNIPVDEDVIVLAIKKAKDKIFLGLKEVKTEAVSELDLDFKEVTVEELKTELTKLNKTFR